MNKDTVGGLLVIISVILIIIGSYEIGKQVKEDQIIDRAKIMDEYNERTQRIICGPNLCD